GALGPEAFGVTLRGVQAYFAALNDRGGVNGRKIDFVTCDDREDGTQNKACAQQLVENDKIFAYVGNNSDTSAASASYNNSKGVPDLGFPLNNGYFKYPHMWDIYYGTGGLPRNGTFDGHTYQLTSSYRWFKQQRGITKAAAFYYIIDVSQSQGAAIEKDLAQEGVPTVYEGGGKAGENPA